MNTQEIVNLASKTYHDVAIDYLHEDEVRRAYFRARDVQGAISNFNECCNDKIIQVLLDPDLEGIID